MTLNGPRNDWHNFHHSLLSQLKKNCCAPEIFRWFHLTTFGKRKNNFERLKTKLDRVINEKYFEANDTVVHLNRFEGWVSIFLAESCGLVVASFVLFYLEMSDKLTWNWLRGNCPTKTLRPSVCPSVHVSVCVSFPSVCLCKIIYIFNHFFLEIFLLSLLRQKINLVTQPPSLPRTSGFLGQI